MIITININKGGTSKTTNAINMAHYLANKKKKVLLIDFDNQCNLTTGMGTDTNYILFDYLSRRVNKLGNPIQITKGIDLYPACTQFKMLEKMSIQEIEYEELLDLEKSYDYIIIDTPPAISTLTTIALNIGDVLHFPVVPERFCVDALIKMMSAAKDLEKPYIVTLNKVNQRTNLHKTYVKEISKIVPTANFVEDFVKNNIDVADSQALGYSIFEYNNSSNGAHDFKRMFNTFFKKLEGISNE